MFARDESGRDESSTLCNRKSQKESTSEKLLTPPLKSRKWDPDSMTPATEIDTIRMVAAAREREEYTDTAFGPIKWDPGKAIGDHARDERHTKKMPAGTSKAKRREKRRETI